nr:MAG TPA: hypothetical protein [Bacteriophage sp.]DAN77939.1 MAG TPA: hypothetical protein [Bacteriophage sp.]DAY38911.1 MAG TPA: hypothetical protein [Caudoviricetes sp.]
MRCKIITMLIFCVTWKNFHTLALLNVFSQLND